MPRSAPEPPKKERRAWRARLKKRLAVVGLAFVLLVVGLRLGIHWVPELGPLVANGLRALIGADAVTRLETLVADAEDWLKRIARGGEEPRSIEEVLPPDTARPEPPEAPPKTPAPARAEPPRAEPPPPERWQPLHAGPMKGRVSLPGDGAWRPVPDPQRPDAKPLVFVTMLHPDAKRPWTEVFVAAFPLAKVELFAVAGTVEPKPTTGEGRAYERRGTVPPEHLGRLLAAFNGGFKTEHGQHGMFVDGVTLVPPREHLCTIVRYERAYRPGGVRIGTWSALADEVLAAQRQSRVVFFRQAAPCMVEGGSLHPVLSNEDARNWGATFDGNVVIRRSAIGLDAARTTLYAAVSNDTTAQALARAMRHIGATDVAQLDVNWSYPKVVMFRRDEEARLRAFGLFEGFLFDETDYVEQREARDFFYVLRADS